MIMSGVAVNTAQACHKAFMSFQVSGVMSYSIQTRSAASRAAIKQDYAYRLLFLIKCCFGASFLVSRQIRSFLERAGRAARPMNMSIWTSQSDSAGQQANYNMSVLPTSCYQLDQGFFQCL